MTPDWMRVQEHNPQTTSDSMWLTMATDGLTPTTFNHFGRDG